LINTNHQVASQPADPRTGFGSARARSLEDRAAENGAWRAKINEMEMSSYVRSSEFLPTTERRSVRRGGLFRRLVDAFVENRRRRKMIAVLETLDDRVLEDIGLTRNDIPSIVDTELLLATAARQRI